MKAILISTRPQWVEKILNGIKKDEIRKGIALFKAINKLIEEQGVAPMLLYCTKGRLNLIYDQDYDDETHAWEKGKYILVDYGDTYSLNGKVVARFNATAEEICYLDTLDVFATLKLGKSLMKRSCLTVDEMKTYLNGRNGTAIHINDLEIFDRPKELNDFKTKLHIKGGCKNCPQYTGFSMPYCKTCDFLLPLTRAPQSYCFIEI